MGFAAVQRRFEKVGRSSKKGRITKWQRQVQKLHKGAVPGRLAWVPTRKFEDHERYSKFISGIKGKYEQEDE